jgi:hypothetical protein
MDLWRAMWQWVLVNKMKRWPKILCLGLILSRSFPFTVHLSHPLQNALTALKSCDSTCKLVLVGPRIKPLHSSMLEFTLTQH